MNKSKILYILYKFKILFIILRFLWFFSKTQLGSTLLSFFLFLELINAKCHGIVLWPICSAIFKFFILSYVTILVFFYIILYLPTPQRYFVRFFGANFLREHLPDDQMAKKLFYVAFIFGLVKTVIFLAKFSRFLIF